MCWAPRLHKYLHDGTCACDYVIMCRALLAPQGVLFKMPPLLAIMCGLLLAPACSLSMSTDLQSLQQIETGHPSMTPGEALFT